MLMALLMASLKLMGPLTTMAFVMVSEKGLKKVQSSEMNWVRPKALLTLKVSEKASLLVGCSLMVGCLVQLTGSLKAPKLVYQLGSKMAPKLVSHLG
jgi:hypothetical protein